MFAAFLILRSRARFFIAATSLVSAEFGFATIDAFRVVGALPDGTYLHFEAIRTPNSAVQFGLICLAAFLFWLDHLRRPAGG